VRLWLPEVRVGRSGYLLFGAMFGLMSLRLAESVLSYHSRFLVL
jgi:hypothetical protein